MPASLTYLVLKTSDQDGWDRFLTQTVGLASGEVVDGQRRYRMDDHDWRVGIVEDDAEGIGALGIEYASDHDLDECLDRLSAAKVEFHEDLELARDRGVLRLVRVDDPAGHRAELVVGRRLAYAPFTSPAGVSNFMTGDQGGMGLGHAVLAAQDVEQSRTFWIELLGFHLTDTMSFELAPNEPAKALYFLHCDNARHHSIALIEFPAPSGLVHFMVEARDIDDVGRFMDRCERDGVVIASRLGRHANDHMISVYAVTPGGSMLEFGCGGLQIDHRNWVSTTSLIPDLWGHMPPQGAPQAS
ncbi:MAG: VOC family protein [Sphingomonadaceae bacterium]|nr:VOC family protein [Sphingomonadaceae bacterium]